MALTVPVVPANAASIWSRNLYTWRAFFFQDPYGQACTAASTMIMLNTIAYSGAGGGGFIWTPYRVRNNSADRADVRDMTSILWFERGHDTLALRGSGSDAHGWRNALNYYGWGSAAMTDPALNVYQDRAYQSYDGAVHAAVVAIARFGMPVGIVAWAGRHAQVMTGYVVRGGDPRVSDAFSVIAVYLSDPLRSDRSVNRWVSNSTLKYGPYRIRFQAYRETDSPYDDPYTPGWQRSSVAPRGGPSEWYRRWVILAPVRAGLPPSPPPVPTPPPSPVASPPQSPQPSVEPTPSPSAGANPSPAPSGLPTGTPTPAASTAPSPPA